MANITTPDLTTTPNTIAIHVDFYDNHEKKLLLSSPIAHTLESLPKIINIPTSDFCTYYLYYKKRPHLIPTTNHDGISRKWFKALDEFDDQIAFSNRSISLLAPGPLSDGTTERIGEAIGLSVSSELHGLHQADWTRIPKTNKRKTLDFWLPWTASDGRQFIQVETKGCAAEDNNLRTPASDAKRDIKAKKKEATDEERRSSILYGTIGVLDNRPDSVARCWIVDPPAGVPDDPERFKIVTRLGFIAWLVSLISPRSPFAAALQTRLAALNALEDIGPLDLQPLRKGDGNEFATARVGPGGGITPFLHGKSVVANEPVGGHVSAVSDAAVFFIGMQERLVEYASTQDFTQISRYSFQPETRFGVVRCVVPEGRFKQSFAPRMTIPVEIRTVKAGYVYFEMQGQLYFAKSGLVFGILPIPGDWRTRQ